VAEPGSVAVIGNIAVDVRWLIDRGYGKKYAIRPRRAWGGYPAAAAQQFQALQVPASVVSVRGADPAGEFVAERVRQAGLDASWLRVDSAPTRQAQILEHVGERTILIEKKRFARWEPTSRDERPLRSAALWCAGGTLDEPGTSDPVLDCLLQLAGDWGKLVCLNPSRLNALHKLDLTRALVQVAADDREALGFSPGASSAELADAFLRRGAALVIVTAGPEPVRGFTSDGQSVLMPALEVLSAAHPTGAGDCVSAVHAWALVLQQLELYTALDLGVAAGALWVAHGRPSPTAEIRAVARSIPPQARFRKAA
jgi:sugar/nucleoside kinase (ribokinase family)